MPTHPLLHIRNAADAHIVFEAVRQEKLPLIRRRLNPAERDSLSSGQVFVWEETDISGGLSRWTDGRRWSQSRMREPFLFYEEKVLPTLEEKRAKAERRARKAKLDPLSASFQASMPPNGNGSTFSTSTFPSSPCPSSSNDSTIASAAAFDGKPCRRQDRPSKPDGLTKQTYSSYVPRSSTLIQPKKWHIVAYFSTTSYSTLPTVDDYPELKAIKVHEGVWGANNAGAKEAKMKDNKDRSARGVGDSARGENHSGLLTRARFRDESEDVEMDGCSSSSSHESSSSPYTSPRLSSPRSTHSSQSGSDSSSGSSFSSSSSFSSLPSEYSSSGYSTPYLFSPLSSISPRTSSLSSSMTSTPAISVASLLNPITPPPSQYHHQPSYFDSSHRSSYFDPARSPPTPSLSSSSTSTSSSSSPAPSIQAQAYHSSPSPRSKSTSTPPSSFNFIPPAPRCSEDARALGAFRVSL